MTNITVSFGSLPISPENAINYNLIITKEERLGLLMQYNYSDWKLLLRNINFCFMWCNIESRVSTAGKASRYGLKGPEIESRWGLSIPHHTDRPWGPHILLCNGYRFFFDGIMAGAWR
jgi:hypothetical protein